MMVGLSGLFRICVVVEIFVKKTNTRNAAAVARFGRNKEFFINVTLAV